MVSLSYAIKINRPGVFQHFNSVSLIGVVASLLFRLFLHKPKTTIPIRIIRLRVRAAIHENFVNGDVNVAQNCRANSEKSVKSVIVVRYIRNESKYEAMRKSVEKKKRGENQAKRKKKIFKQKSLLS